MAKSDNSDRAEQEKASELEEQRSVTQHTVTVNGEEIAYTATAGTLLLSEDEDVEQKSKASVFYVAYMKNDVADVSERPITFAFNGGPGSSSVWLHLGVLGPRRVSMDEEGRPHMPPGSLIDNEATLLDKTDLVFVDPVSTGYSRPAPGEEKKQFHGVEQDIEWVGRFIRLFTSRSERWASPKFLIGESYGTTRAAGLSAYLQGDLGMYLNGIMLISSILNFQSARFDLGNDLPYVLFLPTYAAAAWYHDRVSEEMKEMGLEAFLDEVKAFAQTDYTLALMQGAALSEETRDAIITRLAGYTGLSETYIAQTNLRIQIHRFVKELLRDERRTIGRFDARFKGIDREAVGERHEYDPSYATVQGAYTAAFNTYIRTELNFKSDLSYEILTGNVQPWDYSQYQNQYVNVSDKLRLAMSRNPYLKVFVANGYYDLATPFYATEYTFDHLGLDPALQDNVSMGYYEAGHMMYVDHPSLMKLKSDLTSFVEETLGD